MQFDVFRKRGRGWQSIGVYSAPDSKSAARLANRAHGARIVGVRPEDCAAVKLFVYRFKAPRAAE